MKIRLKRLLRCLPFLRGLALLLGTFAGSLAEPPPAATAAFNLYVSRVEAQMASERRDARAFLPRPDAATDARLRRGELVVEELTRPADENPRDAMLHHWRGMAFAPGATATAFEHLLRDLDAYPREFAPQVLAASLSTRPDGALEARIRVRQKHVLTVVMDTTYDLSFGQLDATHRFSQSRSLRIAEIADPGTRQEHALSAQDEHGFLWRQNTYWRYEERDGGLYLEIESISLSRAIPAGLGWAVRPFVDRVPRESLEFTLRAACADLHH